MLELVLLNRLPGKTMAIQDSETNTIKSTQTSKTTKPLKHSGNLKSTPPRFEAVTAADLLTPFDLLREVDAIYS